MSSALVGPGGPAAAGRSCTSSSGASVASVRVLVSIASATSQGGYQFAPQCLISMERSSLLSALARADSTFAAAVRHLQSAWYYCQLFYMGTKLPETGQKGELLSDEHTLHEVSKLSAGAATNLYVLVDISAGACARQHCRGIHSRNLALLPALCRPAADIRDGFQPAYIVMLFRPLTLAAEQQLAVNGMSRIPSDWGRSRVTSSAPLSTATAPHSLPAGSLPRSSPLLTDGLIVSPSGYPAQYQHAGAQLGWKGPARANSLVDSSPDPPAVDTDEAEAQTFISTTLLPLLNQSPTHTVLIDRHTVESFGSKQPDLVGYLAASDVDPLEPLSLHPGHVVLFGEVKRRRSGGVFTADEKGRVLSMCGDLVKQQPVRAGDASTEGLHRAVVVAFLTDSSRIVFFRATFVLHFRSDSDTTVVCERVEETLPQLLCCKQAAVALPGFEMLRGLLVADPAALGYVPPVLKVGDDRSFVLRGVIGCGATSLVYAGYEVARTGSCDRTVTGAADSLRSRSSSSAAAATATGKVSQSSGSWPDVSATGAGGSSPGIGAGASGSGGSSPSVSAAASGACLSEGGAVGRAGGGAGGAMGGAGAGRECGAAATGVALAADHGLLGAAGDAGLGVAIKIFTASPHTAAEAWRQEQKALTAAADCANIVHLQGSCDSPSLRLVLSPLCPYTFSSAALRVTCTPADLARQLARHAGFVRPPVSVPTREDFCDMAAALQQLHDVGYVHRDLRLDNWMRDARGRIILADLGAATKVRRRPFPHLPFGFSYGPLEVLEAMRGDHDGEFALPTTTFEQDWEQFVRVIIATLAGVTVVHVPGQFGQLADGWKAVDAALKKPYTELLQVVRDDRKRDVATVQALIRALPPL